MANRYRNVFAKPGALRLMSTALLGRLPQGMSALAILLLVRQATNSYAAAGVAVGASALSQAVCGPILGRGIDRFGHRLLVGPAAAAQACVFLVLALAAGDHASALPLIALAALAGGLVPPIAPVVRTILRDTFDDASDRETAFSLEAIAQEAIWLVGPLLATVLITVGSPRLAVALLGAVGLTGTLLFLRSPLLDRPETREHEDARRGSALASMDLRWLLVPVALMGFGLGATEVGIPSLALHDGSRPASGFLLALWSLGSVIGGIQYSSTHWRTSLGTRYAMLLVLNCVSIIPMLFADTLLLAAICSLIAGMAVAPTFSCLYSLVGHVVIPGSAHEAFSLVISGLVAGVAGGSAVGGAVIAPVGVKAPFMLAAIVAGLAALASIRFRGRFAAAQVAFASA